MVSGVDPAPLRVLGRYVLGDEIASGGMATVHFGRMLGPGGFVRTVAIKRLYPHYARDPEFVSMFLDEARLAARVEHPNVVSSLDVVASEGDIFLVMEYVRGESIAALRRAADAAGEPIPVTIALGVMSGVLSGLHAAHEATSDRGEPLCLVHRDVSPQNVLVGADGVARIIDFGIAKARFRLHSTQDGRLKGKLRYMAPEQLRGERVDRRCDVYSASVVLWEMLTGQPMFTGAEQVALIAQVLGGVIVAPSTLRPSLPAGLDELVLRGLSSQPEDRFPTALAMAEALERIGVAATARETGAWVLGKAGRTLDERAAKIVELESDTDGDAALARAAVRPRADSRLETEAVGVRRAAVGEILLDAAPTEPVDLPANPNAPTRSPSHRSTWRRNVALVAGVAALAFGAITLAITPRGPTTAAVPSATAPTSSSSPAVAVAIDLSPPLDLPAPPPSAEPSASPRAAQSPRPRAIKPPRASCDPPYFIDGDGHKQYKPKCL